MAHTIVTINNSIKAKDVESLNQYLSEIDAELVDLEMIPHKNRTLAQSRVYRDLKWRRSMVDNAIREITKIDAAKKRAKEAKKVQTQFIKSLGETTLLAKMAQGINPFNTANMRAPKESKAELKNMGPLAPMEVDKWFDLYENLVKSGVPSNDAWIQAQNAKFDDENKWMDGVRDQQGNILVPDKDIAISEEGQLANECERCQAILLPNWPNKLCDECIKFDSQRKKITIAPPPKFNERKCSGCGHLLMPKEKGICNDCEQLALEEFRQQN